MVNAACNSIVVYYFNLDILTVQLESNGPLGGGFVRGSPEVLLQSVIVFSKVKIKINKIKARRT